jgi:Flp pilus assembly protein TadB
MSTDGGAVIVLVYLLVSAAVIAVFVLAVFALPWLVGRLREHRRRKNEEAAN